MNILNQILTVFSSTYQDGLIRQKVLPGQKNGKHELIARTSHSPFFAENLSSRRKPGEPKEPSPKKNAGVAMDHITGRLVLALPRLTRLTCYQPLAISATCSRLLRPRRGWQLRRRCKVPEIQGFNVPFHWEILLINFDVIVTPCSGIRFPSLRFGIRPRLGPSVAPLFS